jgi:hypothetical protein
MTTNLNRALTEAASRSKYRIQIIEGRGLRRLETLRHPFLQKLAKAIEIITIHLNMGQQIRQAKSQDGVILQGFCTECMVLTHLVSGGHTENVYLLVHHNIQQATQNGWARWGMHWLHRLGYKFIVNESAQALAAIGFDTTAIAQHVSLPHPVVEIPVAPMAFPGHPRASRRQKIGVIGQIRAGKQAILTIQQLLPLQTSLYFTLVIGTDDFAALDEIDCTGAELINTSNHHDYLSALATCDLVVLNYEASRYFYRCSGVVADAIGTSTFVICPDFPLIHEQVMEPEPIGVLYQHMGEFELAIEKALMLARLSDRRCFEAHFIARSAVSMVPILETAIARRLGLVPVYDLVS